VCARVCACVPLTTSLFPLHAYLFYVLYILYKIVIYLVVYSRLISFAYKFLFFVFLSLWTRQSPFMKKRVNLMFFHKQSGPFLLCEGMYSVHISRHIFSFTRIIQCTSFFMYNRKKLKVHQGFLCVCRSVFYFLTHTPPLLKDIFVKNS